MSLLRALSGVHSLFIDTAPFIYFIEAHATFGPMMKSLFDAIGKGRINAFSSVITLVEVLPKPVQAGNDKLLRLFLSHLEHGRNMTLLDITTKIAERAGRLRGKYPALKSMDAIQIAAALEAGADALLTNDKRLRQIQELPVIVISEI